MESVNGAIVEDEKEVVIIEDGSTLDVNKENISGTRDSSSAENEACRVVTAEKDGPDSPSPVDDSSKTAPKIKTPNVSADSKASVPKISKLAKNQPKSKGSVVFGRSTKPVLSQSMSFPSRGRHSDIMKRSIEVYPVDAKQSQKNGSKVESKTSNGSSGPRVNPAKGPYPGVNPKAVASSGKVANRRATIGTVPSFRPSPVNFSVSYLTNSCGPFCSISITNVLLWCVCLTCMMCTFQSVKQLSGNGTASANSSPDMYVHYDITYLLMK